MKFSPAEEPAQPLGRSGQAKPSSPPLFEWALSAEPEGRKARSARDARPQDTRRGHRVLRLGVLPLHVHVLRAFRLHSCLVTVHHSIGGRLVRSRQASRVVSSASAQTAFGVPPCASCPDQQEKRISGRAYRRGLLAISLCRRMQASQVRFRCIFLAFCFVACLLREPKQAQILTC